jgi:3-oxoacyl-[acyl-carrier protein] reductase
MTKKKVLITGGSRGIGKAIKFTLDKEFEVVAPTRSELDLSSLESVTKYTQYNFDFDVLINNAGINIIKKIEDINIEDIRLINQINLESPLLLMQAAIKYMKINRYGRILNISSIWGLRGFENRTLYSGSKFGIIGYTKSLAREVANSNILINSLCPGFTDTEMTKNSLEDEALSALINQVPTRRMASVDEVAHYVKFLVSEKNTYLTGQAIAIDGGLLA